MGLDMYLTAEKYFSPYNDGKRPRVGGIPKGFLVTTVSVRAAQWRKSNQIHAWFVREVQDGKDDCMPYHVSVDKMKELVALCKKVLAEPERAAELLPTKSGFFFGGTEYDEWYFSDLKYTVEQLEGVLKGFDFKVWDFEYRSSW